MSESQTSSDITLEDLDMAIRIIETFINRFEKAKRLLRRLGREVGGSSRVQDMIMEMAIAQTLGKKPETAEEEETELSPEEIEMFRKRARELARKVQQVK
jgi:hypothetical protein